MEYVSIIKASSNDLLAVIGDVLDFSRLDSGLTELENLEFSLEDIIESKP